MPKNERTSLNVRVTEHLKDEIDTTSEERGFSNRSEFVRSVLRDALEVESDIPDHLLQDAETSDEENAISIKEMEEGILDQEEIPIDAILKTSIPAEKIESNLGFEESMLPPLDEDMDIRIIGCGGAGIRIIDKLHEVGIERGQSITIDTDRADLESGESQTRALIGKSSLGGEGTEGDSEKGQEAVSRAEAALETLVNDPDLVFVITGLGGGTGTELAPEVSRIASQTDAVVVGVATLPFSLETAQRETAKEGIYDLSEQTDTLAVLDGYRLAEKDPVLPFGEALERMNWDVAQVVAQITGYIGEFRVSDEEESLLSMLEQGGNSILLHEVVSSDSDYHALSDRLLQFSNIDITSEDIEQAILMFTGGEEVSSDVIDDVILSISQFTEEVAWTAHRDSSTELLRVTGILTGIDIPLDDLFGSEKEIAEIVDEDEDIEILPPKMNSGEGVPA